MQQESYTINRKFEDRHWWFTARREIILSMLQRNLDQNKPNILRYSFVKNKQRRLYS